LGNLNPDDNLVTVRAFFQVCGELDAGVENVSVHYELKAKSDVSGTDGIPFSTDANYTQGLYNVIKLDPLTANDQVGTDHNDQIWIAAEKHNVFRTTGRASPK
jgi:hypothetical protein